MRCYLKYSEETWSVSVSVSGRLCKAECTDVNPDGMNVFSLGQIRDQRASRSFISILQDLLHVEFKTFS